MAPPTLSNKYQVGVWNAKKVWVHAPDEKKCGSPRGSQDAHMVVGGGMFRVSERKNRVGRG